MSVKFKNRLLSLFSCIILIFFLFKYFYSYTSCSHIRQKVIKNIVVLENYNDTSDDVRKINISSYANIPVCILEDVDPWDPSIEKYLKPNRSKKPCNVTQDKHTDLVDGKLFMLKNDSSCKYRCGYPLLNGKVKKDSVCIHHRLTYIPDLCLFDTWKELEFNVTVEVDCDFVETRCFRDEKVVFVYIHTQARPKPDKKYTQESIENPSVLVMVYDATSASSGARTLIETQQVLRKYGAVNFDFYNKAGMNSRPNAVAMYTGIRIQPITKGLYFDQDLPSEIENSCRKHLDRNSTIIYHFGDQGYATIMADDRDPALNYPDCCPFPEPPVEHYAEPLFLLSTADRVATHADFYERMGISFVDTKNEILREAEWFKKYFYEAECEDRQDKLLRYVQNFLDQNEKSAKFIHVWNTYLAHEDLNGLYKWDNMISNFFKKDQKKLENSFIFLMSDHGLRLGEFRSTNIGKYEDNNPMLMVAVPKFLRKHRQLMRNIIDNSRRHVSTYDFYATLYDILHIAKKDQYKKWIFVDFRQHLGEIRGSRSMSLLRPITKDRHCVEMDIPDNFCLCKQTWLPRSNSSSILVEGAKFVIDHINKFLDEHSSSRGLCMKLTFDGLQKVEEHSPKLENPAFRMVVKAQPSKGLYEAIVKLRSDGKWEIASMIDRINRYNKQGDCTKNEDTKPLCYCKEQDFGAKDVLG